MHLPNKAHEGPPKVLRVHRLVVFTALAAIAFGIVVIESYVFDVGPLIPLTPFLPPTQPLVALMFMLAGVSLLSLGVGLAGFQRLPALLATLLAAAILSEYLLQVDFGIDRLLFPQAVDDLSRIFPGRPAPISAAAFLFVGSAGSSPRPVR